MTRTFASPIDLITFRLLQCKLERGPMERQKGLCGCCGHFSKSGLFPDLLALDCKTRLNILSTRP